MFKNKLKKDLYDGKTCFGTFISINSPDLVEIFGIAACKKYGKIPGTFCGTPEAAKARAAQGFRYIAIGMEVTLIGSYLKNVINIAKA